MYRSRKIQAFAPSKRMRSRSASVAPSRKRAPRRALVKSSYARALTSSTGVGLGPSLKTQLKTVYFTTITTAASGFYSGSLKSGSCYDPTGSFSTVQPAEFDQLAAVFGRYVVLGTCVCLLLRLAVRLVSPVVFTLRLNPARRLIFNHVRHRTTVL